ncbi:AAA family ATPase [Aureivirga marina]|uniref:AAA family ATPase n=1 Tax=Aureivirga marina TaxID=1182451 RepID=UPI0018CB391C|nr:AAA family ATPase [Aureivirga marina]
MKDYFDVYTTYNDIERGPLFYKFYECFPSEISLDITLKAKKENMKKALDLIDLEIFDFELIKKTWKISDKQDAKFEDDYVNEYFYKSNKKKITIWICLRSESLDVEFQYDGKDTELETWILKTNHDLREKLCEKPSPSFKVLTSGNAGFSTQEVKTDFVKLDVEKNYNEDFQEVNKTILDCFEEDQSGLILLHGLPGTGKTTYIKNLITKFDELSFIFVQNDFVSELLNPGFISFLIENKNAVLIIEDAEKVIMKREHSGQNSVVSTILQLTDGLFSDYLNIRIICTFNSELDKIDKALLRKGRMIAYYDFKKLSVEKSNVLLEEMDCEQTFEELTLAEIFNYKKKNYQQEEKMKIGF